MSSSLCKQTPLILILCDSITNSVFDSQVLQPLLKHHAPYRPIIIFSYEKTVVPIELVQLVAHTHSNITLHLIKTASWEGMIFVDTKPIKLAISGSNAYELRARGPFAGRIALMVRTLHCEKLVIQARGILAEEYAFTHQNSFSVICKIKISILKNLEKWVYSVAVKQKNTQVEAVSLALKKYLCRTFILVPECITVASSDIPEKILAEQKQLWRVAVRAELGIAADAYVYCYNGSIKAWQCPEATLMFFAEKHRENKHAFLLVLTQNVAQFIELAQKNLPENSFIVYSVSHKDIYRYLAACDAGFLFRKAHVVNWTSRPTKMLEYQALGLPIIHNNTVSALTGSDV